MDQVIANANDVLEMRQSGKTMKEIATHFGVSLQRIAQITSRDFPEHSKRTTKSERRMMESLYQVNQREIDYSDLV